MSFFRYFFQFIVGVVFGGLSSLALTPMLAPLGPETAAQYVYVICAVIVLIVTVAPNIRRAFGRGFLAFGVAMFLLPISTMVLTGTVTSEGIDQAAEGSKTSTAVAGALVGTVATGIAGFVGFFVGSASLIIGLILSLGGRREVVVVNGDKQ